MLKPETYTRWLETLVVSLLAERNDDKDIVSVSKNNPSFNDVTFSPLSIKPEIQKQRESRGLPTDV